MKQNCSFLVYLCACLCLALISVRALVDALLLYMPLLSSHNPSGQQVIEEQRRRLAELRERAALEAQCQWEALHGSQSRLDAPPLLPGPAGIHHSILHHRRPSMGERPYDTVSLESSDSLDTSISTGDSSFPADTFSR